MEIWPEIENLKLFWACPNRLKICCIILYVYVCSFLLPVSVLLLLVYDMARQSNYLYNVCVCEWVSEWASKEVRISFQCSTYKLPR